MVRYGIIGVGAMGREHAENLRHIEGASVTAISDPDEGSRSLAVTQLGDSVKVFTDHKDLLNSGLIDAVIIATPNYTHVDVLKDALATKIKPDWCGWGWNIDTCHRLPNSSPLCTAVG